MGRDRANPSREYFRYEKVGNKSICRICNAMMAGDHASNLERHLKRHHAEHFKEVQRRKLEIIRENDEKLQNLQDLPRIIERLNFPEIIIDEEMKREEFENRNSNIRNTIPTGERRPKRHKISPDGGIQTKKTRTAEDDEEGVRVKLDKNTIEEACVELVTLNGCPFELLNHSGFQKIIRPILAATGRNSRIDAEYIKSAIPRTSARIARNIGGVLKNQIISLKVDIVSERSRSVLGVHAQFVKDGKINLITLGVKDLKGAHVETNTIQKCLTKFGINIRQIYSITVDDGVDTATLSNLGCADDNIDILDEMDRFNADRFTSFNTLTVNKCIAQILPSIIKDTFEHDTLEKMLYECRELAGHLKKFPSDRRLKSDSTKWHSTYLMLETLLECKDIVKNDFYFTDSQWRDIKLIVDTLKPLKDAILRLQMEQSTLSDFFGIWMEIKLKLNGASGWFGDILLEILNTEEEQFLNNDYMLGAIYMDPRFQILLSSQQKIRAVNHLENVWSMIRSLKMGTDENREYNESNGVVDELEEYLREREESQIKHRKNNDFDIQFSLVSFGQVKRIERSRSILEFWERNRFVYPNLYEMAIVALGSPASQVSVERTFSSLKFMLKEKTDDLSEAVLEDMLFVRDNFNYL